MKWCREAGEDGLSETLVRLSSLEVEAFHNDDALRFADEALAEAQEPHERAMALRARAAALGHLHRHVEARAAALEARRLFVEVGWHDWAQGARARALTERILVALHRLPRWLYRPGDMSSLEANRAHPPRFGRLVALVVCVHVGWTVACTAAWRQVQSPLVRDALDVLMWLPVVVGALVALRLLRDEPRPREPQRPSR